MRRRFALFCLLCFFGSLGFTSADLVFVSPAQLEVKLREKEEKKASFKLVDLRLEADYAKGHIQGAVNIPLKKLRFAGESVLSRSEDTFFYGYSSDDRAAVNAVILLVNKGFQHVFLLDGGVKGWKGKLE